MKGEDEEGTVGRFEMSVCGICSYRLYGSK
jgi:hypothetical protein